MQLAAFLACGSLSAGLLPEVTVSAELEGRGGASARRRHGARDAVRIGTALGSLVLIGALGADKGGYWPTAWGWTALTVLWSTVLLVVLRTPRFNRLDVAFAGLLLVLCCWTLLSALWSSSATGPFLETERAVVYVGIATLAVIVVGRGSYRAVLAGGATAVVLVSTYALATRLFPERFGRFNAIAGYRLYAPLGYWNALGIFAAIGALLAFGFAARGRQPVVRAVAAAATVIPLATLYFTYSRGAWIAFAFGAVAMLALDARRLQLLSALVIIAPWSALAVWLGSRSAALTRSGSALAAASHDGHRFAVILVVLAGGAAASALVAFVLENRLRPGRRARAAAMVVIVACLLGAVVGIFARYGSPPTLARRAYHSFTAPAPLPQSDLNKRLFVLSSNGRVRQWRVAWHDYKSHPWLGSGARSYHEYWLQHRPVAYKVLDAHSLYLETLAELGPVGLLLVVGALAVPVLAAVRSRHHGLVAPAFGAYAAYALHAGIDWDWEMPAVTALALVCGAAMLGAFRPEPANEVSSRVRGAVVVGLISVAAFAFVALVSNTALSQSKGAATAQSWKTSESDARKAIRWAPWSSDAWKQLGDVQLQQAKLADARESLRHGLKKAPRDWELWLDLAFASTGDARRNAAVRAVALNPLSPEIDPVRKVLGLPPRQ